jgi:Tfp pilus assembly ATPase PilU
MRYLIDIRLEGKSCIYPIDAKNETQAIERLKLRLPPHQRESFIIDSIEIDPASIPADDPFGVFLH